MAASEASAELALDGAAVSAVLARKRIDIERKVVREVLPYLISAKELGRDRRYRVFALHEVVHGALIGIAGFGFGGWLKAAAEGDWKEFFPLLVRLPLWIQAPAVGAFLVWASMAFYVKQTKMGERGPHIRSLLGWMDQLERRLHRTLNESNPMPELLKLQQATAATVERAEHEGLWPWLERVAPNADSAAEERWATLKAAYEDRWA